MLFITHEPAGAIGQFVDRFWFCSDRTSIRRECILPSGTIEMVVNLADDEFTIYDGSRAVVRHRLCGAIVSGTYTQPFVIDSRNHAAIVGVHFRPGGALPFLRVPASELVDLHVKLRELWGDAATELRDRLCAAATPAARFRILETVLAQRLEGRSECHPAVQWGLASIRAGAVSTMRELAQGSGLSQRRFIEAFATQVGLTPKAYSRVLRFQRARAMVPTEGPVDWGRIALACGYFDQSHMNLDFRTFARLSPTAYARYRRADALPNHVPLQPRRASGQKRMPSRA